MNAKFEKASLTAPTTPEQYRAAIERKERVNQKLRKERDELAARCERLESIIRLDLDDDWPEVERTLNEPPAASLAHVRADAIESAADRVDEWLNESDDDPVTLIRRSAALIRSQSEDR